MTGSDGTFTLGGVPSGATVIVSCIGYTDQVLPEGKSNYVVSLVPDSEMLEETVVVAFGQQKKLSVTGAISTVASADLRKTTSTRLLQDVSQVLHPCRVEAASRVSMAPQCTFEELRQPMERVL